MKVLCFKFCFYHEVQQHDGEIKTLLAVLDAII